jgi:hypothetical protein
VVAVLGRRIIEDCCNCHSSGTIGCLETFPDVFTVLFAAQINRAIRPVAV